MTDIATGLYAHGAIMAALLQRQTTGVGQKIECSLLSTQVWWMWTRSRQCMFALTSNWWWEDCIIEVKVNNWNEVKDSDFIHRIYIRMIAIHSLYSFKLAFRASTMCNITYTYKYRIFNVARRYGFYLRVMKTIFYEWA